MITEKPNSDSQRLDKIIELLEKIDWKLWEVYQKVVPSVEANENPKVIKKVVKAGENSLVSDSTPKRAVKK